MKGKVGPLILTGLIILAGLILIAAGIMRSNLNFYVTIDQLKASGPSSADRSVRVLGEVAKGTWTPAESLGSYTFTLADKDDSLPVRYTGAPIDVPPDRQIVVEGYLDRDGTFLAHRILTKCESRYSARGGGAEKK